MRLNRVSFSAIGSSWPLQNAQPAGAKLPPNIRISPTYGEDMSVPAREDALQGDDPVQHQQRLAVLVRLAAADVRDRCGVERREGGGRAVRVRDLGEDADVAAVTGRVRGRDEVGVCRQFRLVHRVKL